MFALDLFNNDHERRLAEGAVDQLEQRRIDDLAMKMDDLVARAKEPAYKKNPAALAALMKEFQKCKAERDSYYKIRNETMGYGSLGEVNQTTAPAQSVRPGTDLVTPQQRVAGATPPSNTVLGKAKETFTSFTNWLAGKDDTGPTYESTVKEQTRAISPVTVAKYAYEQMRKAHDDNVDIATVRWMNNPEAIKSVEEVTAKIFGPGRYINLPTPIAGGEDFASIVHEIPGAFVFMGAAPKGVDAATAATNHSNKAIFDDAVLADGAALLAELAIDALS